MQSGRGTRKMFHQQFLQVQALMLLVCAWSASSQQYIFSHDHNVPVPVPPRFLVPGAFLAPPPEQSRQLQPQAKNLAPSAEVSNVEVDDRRFRRPFVGRRRPDEPSVGNTATAVPATVTETYRPSTWSTPLLLQQSPQSSAPVPSPVSPFVYSTTSQKPTAVDVSTPAISTIADDISAEEGFTRRLPATVTPYRPNKVQYFPINNPNIIDENEETAVFHNVKTEPPQVSSTSATPQTASPNYIQRKPVAPRFGSNNVRTPRPQQKVRSQPPSQPVVLPPTPPQPRASYDHVADTESNKIFKSYESSPRHETNQPRGKRIKKPVAQVLRKYREDNPDGSITWGFENDDGSFKEEKIGPDCVTRGRYGYIDPDGMRREYSYVQGLPCDREKLRREEEEEAAAEEDANANEPEPEHHPLVKNRARKPTQKF